MGKTTRLPLAAANERASNQRKSGRVVCWPGLSADGVGVQGGEGENCVAQEGQGPWSIREKQTLKQIQGDGDMKNLESKYTAFEHV